MESKLENNVLTIILPERIDTNNANEKEQEIMDVINDRDADSIVLDADGLNYISSAGLRIIMKLIKIKKKLNIIHTDPDVYEIFETTGFTKIISIDKKQ